MYISILGRQPALGIAELEQLYGSDSVRWFSDISATIDTNDLTLERLGGTQKAGLASINLPQGDWHQTSAKIIQKYAGRWADAGGKISLGLSAYGFDVSARDVQKTGILLKQKLKKTGTSLRVIPNNEPALNSAASHHNKLGTASNKVELIAVRSRSGRVIVAESIGAQNITAYTRRDQQRPKRDAFVGMLPPKLAQIMINLATPHEMHQATTRILDPFCGTGVVLQEAALMGYQIYGTDLSDKMIDFSQANLEWLAKSHKLAVRPTLHQGDAMDTVWQPPLDVIVCESYLGQPFSAPPSPSKLDQVRKNCNHIISGFLTNIAPQLIPDTPLCIAVPAWRDSNGQFQHLPLIQRLDELGYVRHAFANVKNEDLLYFRESQVVARELLVLKRK
jgi:tRNA G10  N-methylase Trm11